MAILLKQGDCVRLVNKEIYGPWYLKELTVVSELKKYKNNLGEIHYGYDVLNPKGEVNYIQAKELEQGIVVKVKKENEDVFFRWMRNFDDTVASRLADFDKGIGDI